MTERDGHSEWDQAFVSGMCKQGINKGTALSVHSGGEDASV